MTSHEFDILSENNIVQEEQAVDQNTHISKRLLGSLALGCAVVLTTVSIGLGTATNAEAALPQMNQVDVPECNITGLSTTEDRNENEDKLRVKGNHVYNAYDKMWIPYGISIFGGLQDGDRNSNWMPTINSSMAQIKAGRAWSVNNIRIQWSEANVFNDATPGYGVNIPFLEALCQQIQQVRKQGEVVVLNDQTEFPDWGELLPTDRTEEAWEVVDKMLGQQSGIIDDLYNEPRMTLSSQNKPRTVANVDWLWNVWKKGGNIGGQKYIGMQKLVNFIRRIGFKGIEWIEAPYLENLTLAGRYSIDDPEHNDELEFHHPPMPANAAIGDTSVWYKAFGYLAKKDAVVDGEWNQAASTTSECKSDAYYVVPEYLRYLRKLKIGLDVWSLQWGSMVREPKKVKRIATNITKAYDPTNPLTLERPSRMLSDYACTIKQVGQGVGQWIYNYFHKYSRI
jgi:hypothetical protein